MNPKFLLFGCGVGGNYGCDAFVIGTERIIHRRFPDCEVLLPNWSWRTRNYGDILGNNSRIIVKDAWKNIAYLSKRICEKCGLLNPKQVVRIPYKLVKKTDCILSIGGDLYTFADKEKNWPFPYPIMEAGNEIMRIGKPYVIWCASIGPLEKAGTRLGEMVEHLRACRAIIVREQDSYSYLRDKIGLKSNVYLAADPAFLMEPEQCNCEFLREHGVFKILAINFSLGPIEHVYGNNVVEDIQRDLTSYVQQMLDKLCIKVIFIPHVGSDYEFLTPIVDKVRLQFPDRVWILPENIGARKTKWAVSQANALLTMRFHCSLAGFSTNTPTMILVSTSKGEKICREMYGDLEYALNIRDMNADVVVSKVKDLLDNEKAIRKRLTPASEKMKEQALSAGDILAKVL